MSTALAHAAPSHRSHDAPSLRDEVRAALSSLAFWRAAAAGAGMIAAVALGALAAFALWAPVVRAVGLDVMLPAACVAGAALARLGELIGGAAFDGGRRAAAGAGRDPE